MLIRPESWTLLRCYDHYDCYHLYHVEFPLITPKNVPEQVSSFFMFPKISRVLIILFG